MGIPNIPGSVVSYCRESLHHLVHELQAYYASYPGEEFRFGCGLLLLLPIRKVFVLFLNEDTFGQEKARWGPEMERIWEWIPGSRKLLLPHQS